MATKRRVPKTQPVGTLRQRLEQAEATLRAIGAGEVDALVVSGPRGERTLTLDGAAHPYFVLLDAMGDGAMLLDRDGSILFANRSAGQLARRPPGRMRGSPFGALAIPEQQQRLAAVVRAGGKQKVTGEFLLGGENGSVTPVAITLSSVALQRTPGASRRDPPLLMAIIADLTSRKHAEATRARLLERVMSAQDDERRRIARELHDETGQSLTALLVGLRAITEMSDSDRRGVRTAARRMRKIAARTVDDVARLARGLHPAVLDDRGLAVAARRHTEDYARAMGAGVKYSARRVDTPRLPPLVAATAYRILQETLTNVARHARASNVAVTLTRDASALHLVVKDDGIGFEAPTDESQTGLGLRGMWERATLLGGRIEIESHLGRGTAVSAHLPIAPPSRSHRRRTPPKGIRRTVKR